MGQGIYRWEDVVPQLYSLEIEGRPEAAVIRDLLSGIRVTSPRFVSGQSVTIAYVLEPRMALVVGSVAVVVQPLSEDKITEQIGFGEPVDQRGAVQSPADWFTEVADGAFEVELYNLEIPGIALWQRP
jgi:hypothetical protein